MERIDTMPTHQPPPSIPDEEHYTCAQLARKWNMSRTTIWRWFVNERGVIQIAPPSKHLSRKKERIGLRIPASVADRVYRQHRKA